MGNDPRKTCLFAFALSALVFCVMQMNRRWFISSQYHTIFGGYVGSLLFSLLLTAVGNVEFVMFGPRFQSKLFPEVSICLLLAMTTCGMVHRVCTTACFLFSMISLFYINKISKQAYPVPTSTITANKKKK
ncbi:protein KRTCAP2 homolog [Rhodnius prolixus]